jgi:hypothetical protein
MKNSKFDAKSFLQVKTLSPLETIAIKGGLAEDKQKQKQKQKQKSIDGDADMELY